LRLDLVPRWCFHIFIECEGIFVVEVDEKTGRKSSFVEKWESAICL